MVSEVRDPETKTMNGGESECEARGQWVRRSQESGLARAESAGDSGKGSLRVRLG